jgi:uncharacterized membrane protein
MITAQSFISKKDFPLDQLYQGESLNAQILSLIRKDYPGFADHSYISIQELNEYRKKFLHQLLETEKGELSTLEKEVLASIADDELLSKKLENEPAEPLSLGNRVADRIASFGGSWTFIICFFVFLLTWMAINVVMISVFNIPSFDKYPFILLNLILSCLAAIQAPIIMMSQNRKEARDRQRAENDYKINLKAELEIRLLHEKVDHLILHQNQRLVDIQEIQTDLLNDILKKLEK